MTNKKFGIISLASIAACLLLGALTIIIVDPWFHYHKPLSFLSYKLYDEFYQNDGIARQYDYDAIIVGTSMCENFKASLVDELFGATTVKLISQGCTYHEFSENLTRYFSRGKDVSIVVWGLDYRNLGMDKDADKYSSYPDYLYDDELLNDVNYIFNVKLFTEAISMVGYTLLGYQSTTMDEYSTVSNSFGAEEAMAAYTRSEKSEETVEFTDEDYATIYGNITQNVVALAEANPDVTFYLFFTPYSILYWDNLNQTGQLEWQLQAEREAIELLLACDNIQLYSFFTETDWICDLDNYRDSGHYGVSTSDFILESMAAGDCRLTLDNYEEYCRWMYEYYSSFDYDALFE